MYIKLPTRLVQRAIAELALTHLKSATEELYGFTAGEAAKILHVTLPAFRHMARGFPYQRLGDRQFRWTLPQLRRIAAAHAGKGKPGVDELAGMKRRLRGRGKSVARGWRSRKRR